MSRDPATSVDSGVSPGDHREPMLGPAAGDTSELRNITILCADVVQSTRTVLRLDVEQTHSYLNQTLEPMIAGIRKYGGAIVAIQGDGVIAVFGTPAATEDHALRGCMAAMEVRDTFARGGAWAPGVPHARIRIGLHSGGAWTRRKSGGAVEEWDANGAVVHVATKIERLCPPGSIAASAATTKLIRGYVRSHPLEMLALGGDEPPLQIEQILEVSPDYQLEHYFSQRRRSPFVGREREMSALTAALQATSGPTFIGLIGEAGLGKSRLCYEARAIAVQLDFGVAELRGVSINSATPFAPVRGFLDQLLLAGETQTEEELRAHLRDIDLDESELAAVAALFGLIAPDGAWSKMWGDARKAAIFDSFAKIIEGFARARPLLLIVEDLQDIDYETRTCLAKAMDRLAGVRCVVVVTTRPEGAAALRLDRKNVLVLEQLDEPDARGLVMNELRQTGAGLQLASPDLIHNVLQRGNGNPFVLEELVRGLASPNTHNVGSVPISVEILIRSRVDKLPAEARRVLQLASVLGMRFPAMILRRVSGMEADAFEQALRELVRERFLVADAGMSVEFAHQITRVACYESLSTEARAQLHGCVLETAQTGDDYLALSFEALADHAYRAGQKDRALDFLWSACRDSIAHSAVRSVAELARRALSVCEEVGAAADLRAVDFTLVTFDALQQLGAYRELVGPLQSALKVAEALGAKRQVCHVSGHLATTYWVLGRYEEAHALAERALAAARKADDLPLACYAQFMLGCVQFHRGDIEDAVRQQQEVTDRLSGKLETARFGAVAIMSVQSRAFLCWFLTDLGRFEEAERAVEPALRVANATQQPYSQLLANMAEGYRLFRVGRLDDARRVLGQTYDICRAGSFLALDAMVSGWYAAVLVRTGEDEEARRIVQRVIELDLGRHCSISASYYVYDANARLLAAAGRAGEAMDVAEQAVRLMRDTHDPPHYAYAVFTRAELKSALKIDPEGCARDYRWAMRRAERLGMGHLVDQCGKALSELAPAH
jgi:class 3 adenylate cyclase/tetratricopeptide (TPR) repeat protein